MPTMSLNLTLGDMQSWSRAPIALVFPLLACAGFAPSPSAPSIGEACRGVATEPGTLLVDARVSEVVSLETREGKQLRRVPRGAEIHLVPQPGDSAVLLERRARCDAAHARQDDEGPLGVEGVSIRVRPAGDRFILKIESERPGTAREIAVAGAGGART